MSHPARAARVFISYARSDGDDFARGLRSRLEAAGLPLWRDREGMEGGRDWWQQITAAIDAVEFLVLVITPAALASQTVRREWRYARQRGVAVYPVLAQQGLDFEALPRWMRSVHFYDLAHEWTKFVNDLQTRPQPVRVPFMVEDLPAEFVPRPAETERLLAHLLDRESEEPIAITAALRGAGGYGKTALARALCHDEAIQNAFDDGILWVTLGEQPGDLTARVEDLIFMLSGQRPGFAGLDAATAAFAGLLADRDILFVIDDVWDAAHLQPFMQGGSRCARIITTRNADVLPAQAQRIQVDAMRQDEALALIARGLPAAKAPAEQAELLALVRRLGEWPMLLKLVNAALRDRVVHGGQTLDAALAHIHRALDKRGLTFFDARDAGARHQAVAKTLGLSIAQLEAAEQQRFEELAVFPEDVAIPLATLAAYWGRTGALDDFDTEVLCERLYRLSLVLDFNPAVRFIRLHDVVRQFLLGRQAERLPALHGQLLDGIAPAQGGWAEMPASAGYGWAWLFHHLHGAGRSAQMVTTALDLRYLAHKTLRRSTFEAEADLAAAGRCAEAAEGRQDANPEACASLRALFKGYAQSAHLLGRCRSADEVVNALLTRLAHVAAPQAQRQAWMQSLPPPCLQAARPLPDLPHPFLRRTLSDHRGTVLACAITPDGASVVTAGSDRVIKLWDARSGVEQRRLVGHTSWVTGLAISGDGRLLASASSDRRLRLWDLASGEALAVLAGHTDGLTACALSADGATAVSASLDGTLKLWDTARGVLLRTLARVWSDDGRGMLRYANREGHWSSVHGCDISADGQWLASASSDQTLIVWSLADGSVRDVLAGHSAGVNGCRFSPDGRWLASAGSDFTACIWDVASGRLLHRMDAYTGSVFAVAFGPDVQRLWCGLADGKLVCWEPASPDPFQEFGGHTGAVHGIAVSANGQLVVSASADGSARLWEGDAASGELGVVTPPSGDWLQCCAVDGLGQRILTGSALGALQAWDGRSGEATAVLTPPQAGAFECCALSTSGNLYAAVGADRAVRVWDGPGGAPLHVFTGHRHRVNGCAFDRATTLLATVSSDRSLRLWDVRTRSRKLGLRAHEHEVNCCAFDASGRLLATGCEDGGIVLWSLDCDDALWERWLEGDALLDEATVQRELRPLRLEPRAAAVNALAFADSGGWLASACSDHTLDIWSAAGGSHRHSLVGHRAPVTGCAAHPTAAPWLASTAADGELRVWSAETGQSLAAVRVDGALLACAWADAGRRVVAVGANGLYLFDWRDARLTDKL